METTLLSLKDKELHLVLVGEGRIGKQSYIAGLLKKLSAGHIPTILELEQYKFTMEVCDSILPVLISAAGGKEKLRNVREAHYDRLSPSETLFVLCYAINKKATFRNIENYSIPEVLRKHPKANFFLLGLKADLSPKNNTACKKSDVRRLSRRYNILGHTTCSTHDYLDGKNNHAEIAFQKFVKCLLDSITKKRKALEYANRNRKNQVFSTLNGIAGGVKAATRTVGQAMTKSNQINEEERIDDTNNISIDNKQVKMLIESGQCGALNRIKLMVVGSGGAGKTSCCRALLGEKFTKEHISTKVADGDRDVALLDSKDVNISEQWKEVSNEASNIYQRDLNSLKINFIDSQNMTPSIKEVESGSISSDGSELVVEDMKIVPTPYMFKENVSKVLRNNTNTGDEEIRKFLEDSSGLKLNLWDFAGQEVFDAAHHFYLSNQGITLLVVNLENWVKNREEEEKNLKKWLASLLFYSIDSHLFIVGTRAGTKAVKVKGLRNIHLEIDAVHTKFDDIRLFDNKEDKICFFPVENSKPKANKKMISKLRRAIQNLLQSPDDESQAIWKREVPLSWLFFMSLIESQTNKNIASFRELYEFGKEKGFSGEEVQDLLRFFTQAGCIVSFGEKFEKLGTEAEFLDDTVLKPKWLLNSLASFLFDDIHVETLQGLRQIRGMKSLVMLLRNGFLSEKLFETVLLRNKASRREIRFLAQLCRVMLVMSPVDQIPAILRDKVNTNNLGYDKFWLLPSMLTNFVISEQEMANEIANDETEVFNIKWSTTTPQGLFERFVCSFLRHVIGRNGVELLSVAYNQAVLKVQGVQIYVQKQHMEIFNVVFKPATDITKALVHEMIEEVLNDVNNLGFSFPLYAEIQGNLTMSPTKSNIQEEQRLISRKKSLEWDYDCFLSHSWGYYPDYQTHQQVLRIASKIKHEGFSVWVDENELDATVADEIHRGIDGSACFIAFVTKKYLKSADDRNNNAGKEFNYAALRNGAESIVPVLLDAGFSNPKDWQGNLGFHVGNSLYVDFTSSEAEEENMNRLCSRIKHLTMKKRERRKMDE